MIVSVITARGGSQRLPRKNLAPFCGRPLLAWAIIQTRSCPEIEQTYVSTDDEEIAFIADYYGAIVHMREHADESTDKVAASLPCRRVIEKYCLPDDGIVTLLCTSPLRKPMDLSRLIRKYQEHGSDIGVSTAWPYNEVGITKKTGEDTFTGWLWYKVPRSFDKEGDIYLCPAPTGSITRADHYVTTEKKAKSADPHGMDIQHGPQEDRYYIEVEPWQDFDIDSIFDLELCEYWFRKKQIKEYWDECWEKIRH